MKKDRDLRGSLKVGQELQGQGCHGQKNLWRFMSFNTVSMDADILVAQTSKNATMAGWLQPRRCAASVLCWQGTPQVTELFIDSKRDVDQQLKSTCEDFINHVTEQFTGPLQTFLSRVSVCQVLMGHFWFCVCLSTFFVHFLRIW